MIWLFNHRWAALGLLVSVAYWPFQLEGAFIPRWAAIAVGVPIVSKLDPRALSPWVCAALCYLVAISVFSLVHTPSVSAGIGDLVFVLILSGAFIAGASLDSLDGVMIGLGVGLAVSTVLGALQLLGWPLLPQGSIMPSGLFYNSEMLGEFAGLIAPWAFFRIRPGQTTGLLIFFAAFAALLLTGSRVGFAALAVGVLVAWRPRWQILVPILVACLFVALYALLYTKLSSSMHRLTIWGATIMALNIGGNGLGWVSMAYPFEEFTHSDALQALAELGLGALAMLVIPVQAFRSGRGNHAERALFAAVVVEVFISFPLHFPATGFVAAIVAGFLVGSGPRLCSRAFVGGAFDESRRFWRGDAARADDRRSGGFRLPLSFRSLSARASALCSHAIIGSA